MKKLIYLLIPFLLFSCTKENNIDYELENFKLENFLEYVKFADGVYKATELAVVGETYSIFGKNYYIVDNDILRQMIKDGKDLKGIVTTRVTDMSDLFGWSSSAKITNASLSTWDVSNVTNMSGMFHARIITNNSVDDWDVSKVTNMGGMFAYTKELRVNLSKWDVSNVTNMGGMFYSVYDCEPAGNLNKWNVSKVTNYSNFYRRIQNPNYLTPTTCTNIYIYGHGYWFPNFN